ncbi:hypothetical protein F5B20DRAFT_218627 [Whalleya microplaca]|nr:hypothetical protein F5B20DRAFT_218627 [Whalleya microplaca]
MHTAQSFSCKPKPVPETTVSRNARNMPQLSPFSWLKPYRRRNLAKLVKENVPTRKYLDVLSSTEEHADKVTELCLVSEASIPLECMIIGAKGSCDRIISLSAASTKVGAVATLGMRSVVMAVQADAHITAMVSDAAADRISNRLRTFTSLIHEEASGLATSYAVSYATIEFKSLRGIITDFRSSTNGIAEYESRQIIREIELEQSLPGLNTEAIIAALATAESNIVHAVTDVVITHINIAKPSIGFFPPGSSALQLLEIPWRMNSYHLIQIIRIPRYHVIKSLLTTHA